MQITGCPLRPKPNVSSAYGGVGRVTASAFFSLSGWPAGSTPSRFFFFRSREKANWSYSSQVTSCLPIQNGAILTACWGPSSAFRLASSAGEPITNSPPGMGTISNLTAVPATVSTYGFISEAEAGGGEGSCGAAAANLANPRASTAAPAKRQACDNWLTFGMLHGSGRFQVVRRSWISRLQRSWGIHVRIVAGRLVRSRDSGRGRNEFGFGGKTVAVRVRRNAHGKFLQSSFILHRRDDCQMRLPPGL